MAQRRRRPRVDAVTVIVTAPLPIPKKKRKISPAINNPKRKFTASPPERSIEEFEMLNKIGEGAYGIVYRARNKKNEIVALKKVKNEEDLPETNILTRLHHPSSVDLKHSIPSDRDGVVFLVMEYSENDVRSLLETMKLPFSQSEVKCLVQQLVQGVAYLYRNHVLHQDLKTSNLLLNNRGELKICDFGLASNEGGNVIVHKETVVTLWYRAPELLLGAKEYSTAIDMWAVGCIMAELLLGEPLFDGMKKMEQLGKIFKLLVSPTEAIWPGFSELSGVEGVKFGRNGRSMLRQRFPAMSFTGSAVLSNAGFDLLSRLLTYDPRRRIAAEEVVDHPWFGEVPLPKSKDFMPTFPPNNARTGSDEQSDTRLFGL